jgi:hypothetical protein
MTDNVKIEGEVMGLKDEFCGVGRERLKQQSHFLSSKRNLLELWSSDSSHRGADATVTF